MRQRRKVDNPIMQSRDIAFLFVFSIAVTVSMCAFFRVGASEDSIDRDGHEAAIRSLENQKKEQRYEAGIIIASMASAISMLYINGRKDLQASRAVMARLASAIDRLPCHPEKPCGGRQEI